MLLRTPESQKQPEFIPTPSYQRESLKRAGPPETSWLPGTGYWQSWEVGILASFRGIWGCLQVTAAGSDKSGSPWPGIGPQLSTQTCRFSGMLSGRFILRDASQKFCRIEDKAEISGFPVFCCAFPSFFVVLLSCRVLPGVSNDVHEPCFCFRLLSCSEAY